MAEGKSKTGVVKKRASKREKKDWIAAYIFIAPVTLGLLVFYIWPFIQNIWFSFNEVSKFNVATFCGLANYQKLFHDGEVLRTFGNTLKYVVVTVPVGLFRVLDFWTRYRHCSCQTYSVHLEHFF